MRGYFYFLVGLGRILDKFGLLKIGPILWLLLNLALGQGKELRCLTIEKLQVPSSSQPSTVKSRYCDFKS